MLQTTVNHTDQKWMELIRECRTSGLSDKDWCEEQQISTSTFYYNLRRLRKKGCTIPSAGTPKNKPMHQEVVSLPIREDVIALRPDIHRSPVEAKMSDQPADPVIRICLQDIQLEIYNHADSRMIHDILSAIRALC